jgi:hypothetical protein
LGNEIVRYYTTIGWKSIEDKLRPEFARELLVRPQWFISKIVSVSDADAEAKRAQREAVEKAYQEGRCGGYVGKQRAQRARQFEMDEAARKGGNAGEEARKAQFGFGAAVKITPAPPVPKPAERLEPLVGGGWTLIQQEQ